MARVSLNELLRRLRERGLAADRDRCPEAVALILEGRFEQGATFRRLASTLPGRFPDVFPGGRFCVYDAGDWVDVKLSPKTITAVCRKLEPPDGKHRTPFRERSGPIARLASQSPQRFGVDGYAVNAPDVFHPILEAYHVDGLTTAETARRVASTCPKVTFEAEGRMRTRKCGAALVNEVVNGFGTPRPRSTRNVLTPMLEDIVEHKHFELERPISEIYRESPELQQRFISPKAFRDFWNDRRPDRPLLRLGGTAGLQQLAVSEGTLREFGLSDRGAWLLGYLMGDGWFTQQATGSLRLGAASVWYDAAGPMWVRHILTGCGFPTSLDGYLASIFPAPKRDVIAALPASENPLLNPDFRFIPARLGLQSTKLDRERPFIRDVSTHPDLVDPDRRRPLGERPRISTQYSLMHPWVDAFVEWFDLPTGAGKAHVARLPAGPVSARWFLRGLDCADGCFVASDKGTASAGLTWSLLSASEPFIEQVAAMIERELDVNPSRLTAHRGDREYSQVVLSGRSVATFARWLYGTAETPLPGPAIPRKMERAHFCANSR